MPNLSDYKVFPRHVGRWEGVVRILNAELQESKRYKIRQQFEVKDNQWVITNTYISGFGCTVSYCTRGWLCARSTTRFAWVSFGSWICPAVRIVATNYTNNYSRRHEHYLGILEQWGTNGGDSDR